MSRGAGPGDQSASRSRVTHHLRRAAPSTNISSDTVMDIHRMMAIDAPETHTEQDEVGRAKCWVLIYQRRRQNSHCVKIYL